MFAPTGTVGYVPGFTGLIKVVAHTAKNKEGSMIIERIPSMPHPRLEWTDAVHALSCFWSLSRQSAVGIPTCFMSGLSGKDAGGSC